MSFNEWNFKSIEDLSSRVCVGFVGTLNQFYCNMDEGVPMYRTTNLKDGGLDKVDLKYVTYEFHKKNIKSQLQRDDLLIARHGDNGKACIYESSEEANCLNVVIIRPDISKVVPRFLLYKINSPEVKSQISSMSGGSVQDVINTKAIANLPIKIPGINEQKRIAYILSSFDEKIENNLATNKTLEEIARTIFNEWFVNFNYPNADGSRKQSELGDIPVDWEIGKLGDVLEIKYGKDHKHLDSGKIPVYGSGGIMRYVNEALYEKESILIPRKGTLSNLFYVNKPFWSVDTMFYTKIKNENSAKYLFLLLQTMNLASMNVGTAVPSLTTQILNNIKIIVPSEEILKKFDVIIYSLFAKTKDNVEENENLRITRDSLLPKLMNGEIKI